MLVQNELIFKMNEVWIWRYIFLEERAGGSHDADIILGGVVT